MLAMAGFPPSSFMNSPYIRVGSVRNPSPMIMGVPKSAMVPMKTSRPPAVSEGARMGRMAVQSVRRGGEPRLSAASSIDWSTERSAADTRRKTKGKYCTMNTSRIPRQP